MVQFSERQLKARGYEVSKGPPAGWNRTREWENKRTRTTLNVLVGIDPGWGHNTGLLRSQVKADRLIRRLEEAEPGLARAMVQEGLEDPAFLSFMTGAVPGDWPVAVVPQGVLGAIGGRSRILRLSRDTVRSHPRFREFETEDWLRVQGIADEGRVFRSVDRNTREKLDRVITAFREEWQIAVKATKDGEKTFMTTLHHAESRHLRRAERNLDEIVGK